MSDKSCRGGGQAALANARTKGRARSTQFIDQTVRVATVRQLATGAATSPVCCLGSSCSCTTTTAVDAPLHRVNESEYTGYHSSPTDEWMTPKDMKQKQIDQEAEAERCRAHSSRLHESTKPLVSQRYCDGPNCVEALVHDKKAQLAPVIEFIEEVRAQGQNV